MASTIPCNCGISIKWANNQGSPVSVWTSSKILSCEDPESGEKIADVIPLFAACEGSRGVSYGAMYVVYYPEDTTEDKSAEYKAALSAAAESRRVEQGVTLPSGRMLPSHSALLEHSMLGAAIEAAKGSDVSDFYSKLGDWYHCTKQNLHKTLESAFGTGSVTLRPFNPLECESGIKRGGHPDSCETLDGSGRPGFMFHQIEPSMEIRQDMFADGSKCRLGHSTSLAVADGEMRGQHWLIVGGPETSMSPSKQKEAICSAWEEFERETGKRSHLQSPLYFETKGWENVLQLHKRNWREAQTPTYICAAIAADELASARSKESKSTKCQNGQREPKVTELGKLSSAGSSLSTTRQDGQSEPKNAAKLGESSSLLSSLSTACQGVQREREKTERGEVSSLESEH